MTKILLRGGTTTEWARYNPILRAREPGVETDTGRTKIGDGVTPWLSLNYSAASSVLFFSVDDYGAVGTPLTIADAGLDVETLREESGEDWLEDTHYVDLAAICKAQKAAEDAGGGTVVYSKPWYYINSAIFARSGVTHSLGGATVENVQTDGGDFTFGSRVFLFGTICVGSN